MRQKRAGVSHGNEISREQWEEGVKDRRVDRCWVLVVALSKGPLSLGIISLITTSS